MRERPGLVQVGPDEVSHGAELALEGGDQVGRLRQPEAELEGVRALLQEVALPRPAGAHHVALLVEVLHLLVERHRVDALHGIRQKKGAIEIAKTREKNWTKFFKFAE